MNYEFPVIENIRDILPAIEGRSEFTVAVKDGYTVINYNVVFNDTFPPIDGRNEGVGVDQLQDLYAMLRRECRGIIFDTATGDIIRRPFHKFFNVNERAETQDHLIDLSRPNVILEKLDGSMIAPFIVNGRMIWGTKMGETDVAKPVEEFVARNRQYIEFAQHAIDNGWTPIFEWCSRKQRIVLDYSEDQLILTAIRNTNTGQYVDYNNLKAVGLAAYNIPVVRAFDPQQDMREFVEYVRDLNNIEGFVVRFANGHMVKVKAHWYLQIHKAKEAIVQDRNIVELIIEGKLDDIKGYVSQEDRDRLTKFESEINRSLYDVTTSIVTDITDLSRSNVDRKTFAIERAPNLDIYTRQIIFALWGVDNVDRERVFDCVRNMVRNNLGKTAKYEAIRDVWFPGVVYNV